MECCQYCLPNSTHDLRVLSSGSDYAKITFSVPEIKAQVAMGKKASRVCVSVKFCPMCGKRLEVE